MEVKLKVKITVKLKIKKIKSKMYRCGKPVRETDRVKNTEGCRKKGNLAAFGGEKEQH